MADLPSLLEPTEVVVCGPSSWNLVVDVDELPAPVPHTQFATGSRETLGGTSAGKALHLRALGRTALLHTVVGDDGAADHIRDALAGAGVPVSAEVVPGPSERHLNLMDPRGGRVSIYLHLPGEAQGPPARDLVRSASRARALVMDLSARSRDLLEVAREAPASIWTDLHDYDGHSRFHRPWLECADYVFMNADGLPEPLDFMRAVIDRGPARLVVCTLGAQGAVAVDADHRVHEVPARPVEEVVDTNGAGDAFMAGFLAATLDGAGTESALDAGATHATTALSTRHLSPLLDDLDGLDG
jgi:acarbose 7IV-phosphotransferase